MDEVKAGSLFEKVILPLRDDEYLDGDGFPRCKSCHTLRVYVSDDKTFCARCLCKCQSDQIEKEKELAEKEVDILKKGLQKKAVADNTVMPDELEDMIQQYEKMKDKLEELI